MKKKVWDHALGILFPSANKILLKMKLTLCIILFSFLGAMATDLYSQTTKLSLDLKNTSVKEVLGAIENQSEFFFLYSEKIIDINREVNIEVHGSTIEKILDKIFTGTNVNYMVKGRQIVLTTPESYNFFGDSQAQQQKSVSGKVTDSSGGALPGASVVVKGTTNGTITDANGNFSLSNVPENSNLQFSFVGMKGQEHSTSGKSTINVTLEEDAIGIEEVVAVGYSTKAKKDITGSISTVSSKSLVESAPKSLAEALQGRAAGVYVKSNSGQPGGGVSVRIRGIGGLNNSEPLYVIDGSQSVGGTDDNYNGLSGINPNDIESIQILKDASSAAIYGARGANGVVIVTTKRGSGGKPKLTYSGSVGIQNMINPNNFGVLNSRQYAEVVNATLKGDGKAPVFGSSNTSQYPAQYFPAPSSLGEGTNWMDEITRTNAPTQEHQLSLSGGNTNHKYYVSLNYLNEDGILINSSFKRYTFRINTDNTVTKFLKIGNSFSVNSSISNLITSNRSDEGGVVQSALVFSPAIPVYNSDGSLAGPPTAFYPPGRTPVASIMGNEKNNSRSGFGGNIYGEITFLKGLSFKSTINASIGLNSIENFTPTYAEGIVSSTLTKVGTSTDRNTGWLWSNVLSYNKIIGKHHVASLLGTEASKSNYNSLVGNSTYSDNAIRIVSSSGSLSHNLNQVSISSSSNSYFGSLSYNYDSKYYLEGNVRKDGSSKFGKNSHWGVFPSFSGAWRISKESFFPVKAINDLKLRGSYGKVGSDKIGDFAYIAALRNVFYAFGGNNGSFTNGLAIDALANPDLKWETSVQTNFGIDMSLLSHKLSITADYFETKVSDMLLGLQIPAVTGINSSDYEVKLGKVISNAGSLTNKGFEFEASYKSSIGKINYTIGASLTTFNNKVTNIGNNKEIWGQTYQAQNVSRTVVGGSLGEFYGYVVEGIFQTPIEVDAANSYAKQKQNKQDAVYQSTGTAPGDFKFKDIDGDGIITAKDRAIIGSPIPDFTYGINLNLQYNCFEMSMLFSGIQGNEIYNANRMDLESSSRTNFNKSKTVLNSWNGAGSSNTIPRRIESDPNLNKRVSSIFVEDGSYISLRNIQITYFLPKSFNSKLSLSDSKVFISGQNMLTFTKYSGFDPEIGNVGGSNLSSGIDNDVYPHAKTIRLGVLFNF